MARQYVVVELLNRPAAGRPARPARSSASTMAPCSSRGADAAGRTGDTLTLALDQLVRPASS
jgi:hypothetical protein